MKYPLTSKILNKIKNNIKELSETFRTTQLYIDRIGMMPFGRKLVESDFWPKNEAIDLFEKEGAVKVSGNSFKILKNDYFNIQFNSLSLPISFSIEDSIKTNLAIMTGLYAEIYDVENRLRFYIATKLEQIHGKDFFPHLPRAVRESITKEKARPKLYILDPRNKELEYSDFNDLKKVIENIEIISDKTNNKDLIDKLTYLNDARTLIAHNNIIVKEEVQKIKDYCSVVRRILI
jgi:hypothetical protein